MRMERGVYGVDWECMCGMEGERCGWRKCVV